MIDQENQNSKRTSYIHDHKPRKSKEIFEFTENYYLEKYIEAYESIIEKTLEKCSYSNINELISKNSAKEFKDKMAEKQLKILIHQVRASCRSAFRTALKEMIRNQGLDVKLKMNFYANEKKKIWETLNSMKTQQLLTKDPESYLEFMRKSLEKIEDVNKVFKFRKLSKGGFQKNNLNN